MQFSLNEIAAILGSQWRGPDGSVSSYSIDSRSLEAGDLFFAIRGPRHDGHDFIEHVMGKGGKAAVVSNDYCPPRPEWDAFLLPVPDTTRALQQLAHAARRKWSGRVIGITGSTGKTTTKEMIASLLSRRFSGLKPAGTLNNHMESLSHFFGLNLITRLPSSRWPCPDPGRLLCWLLWRSRRWEWSPMWLPFTSNSSIPLTRLRAPSAS